VAVSTPRQPLPSHGSIRTGPAPALPFHFGSFLPGRFRLSSNVNHPKIVKRSANDRYYLDFQQTRLVVQATEGSDNATNLLTATRHCLGCAVMTAA
jgi:hypothetical protein